MELGVSGWFLGKRENLVMVSQFPGVERLGEDEDEDARWGEPT